MEIFKKSRRHLEETGWSYWYHLYHSFYQSGRLILISIKSIIHGFFPWLFPASGPVGIYKIYKEIRAMHHVKRIFSDEDTQNKL